MALRAASERKRSFMRAKLRGAVRSGNLEHAGAVRRSPSVSLVLFVLFVALLALWMRGREHEHEQDKENEALRQAAKHPRPGGLCLPAATGSFFHLFTHPGK